MGIPGTFFEDGYVQFSRIGSSVFLLIQIYVLIGWAWDCNDRIIDKIDEMQQDGASPDADEDEVANKRMICLFQTLLFGGTAAIYAAVVTLWVFEFQWFVYIDQGNCQLNQAMLALMVILVLILTVLPPLLRNGSIFTTAIVSFYISYLTFAGLEASDDVDCNWYASSESSDNLSLWLGFLFTIAAISYTGFSVSKHFVEMSDGSKSTRADDRESAKDNSHDDDEEAEDGGTTSNYDDAVSGGDDETTAENPKDALMAAEKKANVTFHVCMTFASIYMCMLYTGWGDDQISSDAKARGTTAMVVNILCVWVTAILYGWTLVAPKMCPSRFGEGDDDDDEEINMEI